ncbi:AlpA family phage regulatory protein [Pseudomonas sp. BN417]|uniref:helix-turn-helix transcriptional regulator n=1 Tax=Pseudomonas sp. BN417 TaxID=2567890 RepID=UPI002453906B|nr:AlpA family phage regulatory protein [Pseudomonas sp. BN417]MDH4555587.1 AlpA family phage regulatory protein [Pseudomonas sp. BN417]
MHANAPLQKLSIKEICALEGLSRSGLYKLMKADPTFPKPIKSGPARGARVRFLATEIAAWQEQHRAMQGAL